MQKIAIIIVCLFVSACGPKMTPSYKNGDCVYLTDGTNRKGAYVGYNYTHTLNIEGTVMSVDYEGFISCEQVKKSEQTRTP